MADPWGLLLGATAGGAAWAVDVPIVAAGFVGVVVWVSKAGLSLFQKGEPRAEIVHHEWLSRAQKAAERFTTMIRNLPSGPVEERLGQLEDHITDAVATIERLAQQAVVVEQAIGEFDVSRLQTQESALVESRRTAKTEVAEELDKSIASVRAQLVVYDRLTAARERLNARLESGTLGLESLGAQVIELSTLSIADPTAAGSAATLDQLSEQLEGLRKGLVETEEITRKALGGNS